MVKINNYKKLDNAFNDYIQGMSYREISFKYNVSINTVKSWVRRYNWATKKTTYAPRKNKEVAKSEIQKVLLKLELEIKDNKIINAKIK